MECVRCGKGLQEEDAYYHLQEPYCEDCYMDVLNPPKACDPWAVHSAKMSLKGRDAFEQLTPVQQKIVSFVRERSEADPLEVAEAVGITGTELMREFATLRHMELLAARKQGEKIVLIPFEEAHQEQEGDVSP